MSESSQSSPSGQPGPSSKSRTKERPCPFCAEPVTVGILVCPHCRSSIDRRSPIEAHRNRPGRQVAGVAIALAETFGLSVTLVRLLFIITTFINLVGLAAYALLWLTMPEEPGGSSILSKLFEGLTRTTAQGERSIFETIVGRLRDWAHRFDRWLDSKMSTRSVEPEPPPPPPPPTSTPPVANGETGPPREQAS